MILVDECNGLYYSQYIEKKEEITDEACLELINKAIAGDDALSISSSEDSDTDEVIFLIILCSVEQEIALFF